MASMFWTSSQVTGRKFDVNLSLELCPLESPLASRRYGCRLNLSMCSSNCFGAMFHKIRRTSAVTEGISAVPDFHSGIVRPSICGMSDTNSGNSCRACSLWELQISLDYPCRYPLSRR